MSKGRAYTRHMAYTKAKRKQKISKEIFGFSGPHYNNLHSYSKNKVHCSCPMCNKKTNLKKHGKYRCIGGWGHLQHGGKYYTLKDAKRIEAMNYEYGEYSSAG